MKNFLRSCKIMISKEKAIKIAKSKMPSKGYKVDNAVLKGGVWYVGLSKNGKGFEVEIDANTGKVIGGGGGA